MFHKHVLDYLQASDRLVCRRCRQNVDDAGEVCPATAPRVTVIASGEIDAADVLASAVGPRGFALAVAPGKR